MNTDEKIAEMAGAIRLLAWHVQRLEEIADVSPARESWGAEELTEVRAAMQKVSEACPVACPTTRSLR